MIHTGLRPAELFALEKDMIDLDNHCIRVTRDRIKVRNRALNGEKKDGYKTIIVDNTKTKSSNRFVPLNNVAFAIIEDAMAKSDNDLVFPNVNGNVVTPCPFRHSFDKICKRAGVKNVSPYSLRHTFATRVINNTDMKIEELAKIMGHSSIRVTYDTYFHQQKHKMPELSKMLDSLNAA